MGAGGASGRWVMSERRDRRAELRRSAAGRPRRVSLGFFFQPPPPPLLPPLPFLFSCRCFPSHPTPALRSFPRGPARWGSFRAAVMDGAVRAGGSSASRARTKLRTAAAVRCSEPCPPRPPPPPPPPRLPRAWPRAPGAARPAGSCAAGDAAVPCPSYRLCPPLRPHGRGRAAALLSSPIPGERQKAQRETHTRAAGAVPRLLCGTASQRVVAALSGLPALCHPPPTSATAVP